MSSFFKDSNSNFIKKKFKCVVEITLSYSEKVKTISDIEATVFLSENEKEKFYYLNEVLDELNKSYSITNKSISVYNHDIQSFLYCGIHPFEKRVKVPLLTDPKKIFKVELKIRNINTKPNMLRMEINDEIQVSDEAPQEIKLAKRSKERKIGSIVEKVFLWRKLFTGYKDEVTNKFIRYSLDEASEFVRLPKKSLDDYLIQIRKGKELGFDFNENQNKKVGFLRAFVKSFEKKDIEQIEINKSHQD